MRQLKETLQNEADFLFRIQTVPEIDVLDFMGKLAGGTYFNMGMCSRLKPAKAFKSTLRIYKILNLAAIVSGVSYENLGTTKDFRAATGKDPGHAWYDQMPGYENKVAVKKSDPNAKYVLWDVNKGSQTWVRYYIADIATGDIQPISLAAIEQAQYLTPSEINKLKPKPVTGINLQTGAMEINHSVWRTAAFENIFWLKQTNVEFGKKFVESYTQTKARLLALKEAVAEDIFVDAFASADTDLDAILSGEQGMVRESVEDTTMVDVKEREKEGSAVENLDELGQEFPIAYETEDDIEITEDLDATSDNVFEDKFKDMPEDSVDQILSGQTTLGTMEDHSIPKYTTDEAAYEDDELFTDFPDIQ